MSTRRVVALASAILVTVTTAAVVPIEAHAATGGLGTVHASPTIVRAQNQPFHVRSNVTPKGPLGRDGRPMGSNIPTVPAAGQSRPASVTPNRAVSPFAVSNKFNGPTFATSSCGCWPPDLDVAAGPSNIVEVSNSDMTVTDLSGTSLLTETLGTLMATADPVVEPRVLYDPSWNRWVIVATDNAGPSLLMAFSQTGDPTGSWTVYKVGYPFPAGSFLDFPMVGMDRDAVVITTNNFSFDGTSLTYADSTAIALPKITVYNGAGFSVPLWGVVFGTAPAVLTGSPTLPSNFTYLVGLDQTNSVADVYRIANDGNTPKFVFRGQATYAWALPPRNANQPGTAVTLTVGDGRITSPVSYDGSRLWFAHTVGLGSFPGVQWGYVSPGALTVTVASAFHSATSDDFNPSVVVQYNGANRLMLLNWTYTDTANTQAATDVYKFTGTVQHLSGDPYSPTGSSTSTQNKFGAYSSAAPEYNNVGLCGSGKNAVIANEYFSNTGTWKTEVARVHTTC